MGKSLFVDNPRKLLSLDRRDKAQPLFVGLIGVLGRPTISWLNVGKQTAQQKM